MQDLLILNGPNLQLTGQREPGIYGSHTFSEKLEEWRVYFAKDVYLQYQQYDSEGELIAALHRAHHQGLSGVVFNPAAYTHTSIALADAIAAITVPVIEVHLSNIYGREDFRRQSYTAPHCLGVISGLGMESYRWAIHHFISLAS